MGQPAVGRTFGQSGRRSVGRREDRSVGRTGDRSVGQRVGRDIGRMLGRPLPFYTLFLHSAGQPFTRSMLRIGSMWSASGGHTAVRVKRFWKSYFDPRETRLEAIRDPVHVKRSWRTYSGPHGTLLEVILRSTRNASGGKTSVHMKRFWKQYCYPCNNSAGIFSSLGSQGFLSLLRFKVCLDLGEFSGCLGF